MAKEICKEFDKTENQSRAELELLFAKTTFKYAEDIKREYGVDITADGSKEEGYSVGKLVGQKVAVEMAQECPYALMMMASSMKENEKSPKKEYTVDPTATCENVKTGEFYYLGSRKVDTTFVTFSKGYYVERTNSGHYYSIYSPVWKDDCTLSLTLIETNNPVYLNIYKVGQELTYQLAQNSEESMVLKSQSDEDFYIEYIKIDHNSTDKVLEIE